VDDKGVCCFSRLGGVGMMGLSGVCLDGGR